MRTTWRLPSTVDWFDSFIHSYCRVVSCRDYDDDRWLSFYGLNDIALYYSDSTVRYRPAQRGRRRVVMMVYTQDTCIASHANEKKQLLLHRHFLPRQIDQALCDRGARIIAKSIKTEQASCRQAKRKQATNWLLLEKNRSNKQREK